jgi:cbb3-type cytochrome oxidase subunit 3
MNFYKGLGFYSSLATIFILFSLIVYFCYRSHLKIANNLSPLLFVSDSDANIISENASKIKYAV